MDPFTTLSELERQFGTPKALDLMAKAERETMTALSDRQWLLGYPQSGAIRYDLVGVR